MAGFATIEAARRLPLNSRSIIKAAYSSPDGDRYGLFFLNQFGAFAVSGIQADNTYGTLRAEELSATVNWWRDEASIVPRLDLNNLHTICGTYWPPANHVMWAVPMLVADGQTEQTTNNRVIVYDLNLGAWLPPWEMDVSVFTTAYHYSADAPGKLGALGLYAGDYTGRVLRLLNATADDGAAIAAEAKTGYLHCETPGIIKKLWKLRLFGATEYTGGITVTPYLDGETAGTQPAVLQRTVNPIGKEFVVDFEDMNLDFNFIQLLFQFTGPTALYGAELEWTGEFTEEGQE